MAKGCVGKGTVAFTAVLPLPTVHHSCPLSAVCCCRPPFAGTGHHLWLLGGAPPAYCPPPLPTVHHSCPLSAVCCCRPPFAGTGHHLWPLGGAPPAYCPPPLPTVRRLLLPPAIRRHWPPFVAARRRSRRLLSSTPAYCPPFLPTVRCWCALRKQRACECGAGRNQEVIGTMCSLQNAWA